VAFSRRKFLTLAGVSAASVTMFSPLEAFYARVARGQVTQGIGYGSLEPKLPVNADELTTTIYGDLSKEPMLALPPRFNYRALSITGQPMSDGNLVPADHDGMAAFPGPKNTIILVRNHELDPDEKEFKNTSYGVIAPSDKKYNQINAGGTTTLVLGSNRQVIRHFASLAGTIRNCAGGPTPWRSWISCEETFNKGDLGVVRHGYNFEVPAKAAIGLADPIPLKAMGRFSHEAIAVDPKTGYIYETEDRGDSCFYRFVPAVGKVSKPGQLAQGGTLYALKIRDRPTLNTSNNPNNPGASVGLVPVGMPMSVEWVKIDNVDPDEENKEKGLGVRYEAQSKGAAIFFRGEGVWYGNGLIYFTATQGGPPAVDGTRGNGQVWVYDPMAETITLLIEAEPSGELLDEPDNITVAPFGDLFLCEDGGGEQYVVGVNREGEVYQFAKNIIFANSSDPTIKDQLADNEFAGACFSPDGRTLFVNIQTPGITFAIWGPWERRG
jgi:hypothetical protein